MISIFGLAIFLDILAIDIIAIGLEFDKLDVLEAGALCAYYVSLAVITVSNYFLNCSNVFLFALLKFYIDAAIDFASSFRLAFTNWWTNNTF